MISLGRKESAAACSTPPIVSHVASAVCAPILRARLQLLGTMFTVLSTSATSGCLRTGQPTAMRSFSNAYCRGVSLKLYGSSTAEPPRQQSRNITKLHPFGRRDTSVS